jgi:uncharacterized protein (DUF1330 family)
MTKSQKLTMAVVAGALLGIGGTLAIHGQKVATPPGYVIAEVEVTDPAAMKQYGGKVAETLAPFQHRYVVRSGKFQALEGEAPKGGLVMIEFDSVEKAREWYDSPAYAAIRPIRQRAAKSRIYIVEGEPR